MDTGPESLSLQRTLGGLLPICFTIFEQRVLTIRGPVIVNSVLSQAANRKLRCKGCRSFASRGPFAGARFREVRYA